MWSLPAVRQGHPAPASLLEQREQLNSFVQGQPIATGIAVRSARLVHVPCEICAPARPVGTLLYLHGGGFRMGGAREWLGFCSRLAQAGNARVVVPDYRLAPEHPFPAALYDLTAVYDALRTDHADAIACGGDSAGGGLAVSLALACRVAAIPPPRGLVLLSPWLDLTLRAGSFDTRAVTDRFFSRTSAQEAAEQYLQGHPADDPLVSPLLSQLDGLPPTLLFAGGDEVLLDDTLELTRRLATASVSVEAHVVAEMQHVWPMSCPDVPESAQALRTIGQFFQRLFATQSEGS